MTEIELAHPLLGDLERLGNYLCAEAPFQMFGKAVPLRMLVKVYPGESLEPQQEEAIACFVRMRERLGSVCAGALMWLAQEILAEGCEPEPELVAADGDHLRGYAVVFPALYNEPTWGLTCMCKWNDKGVAIRFVREKIVEGGIEHLLT